MPAMLAAGLTRALPLLAVLAAIAVAIYVFVSWKSTPARAKEVLIEVFVVLNSALSAFFLLALLYAALEGNAFVGEFFAVCLITTLAVLGITLLCRRTFLKHNPNYRWRVTQRAEKHRRDRNR